MKVYNREYRIAESLLSPVAKAKNSAYRSPKFHLLPVAEADILTSSPLAEEEGTNTPILNEDGIWDN